VYNWEYPHTEFFDVHSTNMNTSYYSSSSNDYSFEYSTPSIPAYCYSPSFTPCPVHSSYLFYSSPTQSINTSPAAYSYYQQQQSHVFSLPAEQRLYPMFFFLWLLTPVFIDVNIPTTNNDRTPLRRHQCFKKNELEVLYQVYIQNSHPSSDILQQLAIQLDASVEKVRVSYLLDSLI
jgi:hypothetical protein